MVAESMQSSRKVLLVLLDAALALDVVLDNDTSFHVDFR
jgi:hypothetical protein